MLKSMATLTVPITVNGLTVNAIVDSAAEVTIISDRIYAKLHSAPCKVRDIRLDTAGRELSMTGFIADPFELQIGPNTLTAPIYVAPIEQDMLLGMDLLLQGNAVINIGQNKLVFNGHPIQACLEHSNLQPKVSRVSVGKRTVIPPHSAMKVNCVMDRALPDYVVEPNISTKMFGPRVVHKGDERPVMCFVNTSDRYLLFKKGKEVGQAYPVASFVETEDISQPNPTVQGVTKTQSQPSSGNIIPEHLKDMMEASSEHLSPVQQKQLGDLLSTYEDVFAKSEFDLGTFTGVEHSIDTGTAKPVRQRMRRTPVHFADEEEAHLQKMIKAGVIQESTSEWASCPVLIRKRDGSIRWCIDYRGLNRATVKDVYPLPLIDDCLDALSGNVWFSKLDANSAYWQVNIKPEDRKKTAFHTKYGLYEHVKLGFGLCNAPATFSRVMNLILRGLNWQTVLAFLDDILVLGKTFEEHLENLESALSRFRSFGMKLKPKKCIMFQKKVEFLGRIVDGQELSMSASDVSVVSNWPVPTCSKDVERFMGLVNYHRTFIPEFSLVAEPLYRVVGKHNYKWTEEQQEAFDNLKVLLTSQPILALPRKDGDLILDTDASDTTIGAVLSQIQEGKERVLCYGSFAMTREQRRYCTTRKELLAIVRFTRQYRHYLLGTPFTVRTDHSSLTWLFNFKDPQGQLARWIEELSQYHILLKHRPGKYHTNADVVSRKPEPDDYCNAYTANIALENLPCGGCDYCRRADENWGSFIRDVDEAVPLTMVTTRNGGVKGKSALHLHGTEGTGVSSHVSGLHSEENSQSMSKRGRSDTLQQPTVDDQVTVEGGKPVDSEVNNLDEVTVQAISHSEQPIEDQEVFVEITSTETGPHVKVCGVNLSSSAQTCWGFDLTEVRSAQDKT